MDDDPGFDEDEFVGPTGPRVDEAGAEGVRRALAVITAWHSEPDDTLFAHETLSAFENDVPGAELSSLRALTAGLVSLSGMLLLHLSDVLEVSPDDVLRDYAMYFAELAAGGSDG